MVLRQISLDFCHREDLSGNIEWVDTSIRKNQKKEDSKEI